MKRKYTTNELMAFIKKYLDELENPGELASSRIADYCRKKCAAAYQLQEHDFRNNKEVKAYIDDYNKRLRSRYINETGDEEHLLESTLDINAIAHHCKNEDDFREALSSIGEELERLREQNNKLFKSTRKANEEVEEQKAEKELNQKTIEVLKHEIDKLTLENKGLKKANEEMRAVLRKSLAFYEDTIVNQLLLDHFIELGLVTQTGQQEALIGNKERLILGDGDIYPIMKAFDAKYERLNSEICGDSSETKIQKEDTEQKKQEPIDFRKKWLDKL